MNWIVALRAKIKLQEGSTKRGISAVVTGGITLYLVFKGQPADSDAILQTVTGKVEFWIGVGLNIMGLLGIFIPDESKTLKIELPPLELVSSSLSSARPLTTAQPDGFAAEPAPERLRDDAAAGLSARFYAEPAAPAHPVQQPQCTDQSPGWNG